jgi:hypothetical protein
MINNTNTATETKHNDRLQELRDLIADGHRLYVCFGGGVDSTAMLVELYLAGIVPDMIGFADTGVEKPETYDHVRRMDAILEAWGFPTVIWAKKRTKDSTPYNDIGGNCLENETLPSLAFGMKSCSVKWKQDPQDHILKGVTKGPNKCLADPMWIESQNSGRKIVKLIGYDSSPADIRRSKKVKTEDAEFLYRYPLQTLGYVREDCVRAITGELGPNFVPIKSACFFCPASKIWELYWLAGNHPELFEKALLIERTALTGHHSRLDHVDFGGEFEDMVRNGDTFPSKKTTVGLGRSFAWGQWATTNNVIDPETNQVDRERLADFRAEADRLRGNDNALDRRSCADVDLGEDETNPQDVEEVSDDVASDRDSESAKPSTFQNLRITTRRKEMKRRRNPATMTSQELVDAILGRPVPYRRKRNRWQDKLGKREMAHLRENDVTTLSQAFDLFTLQDEMIRARNIDEIGCRVCTIIRGKLEAHAEVK